MELRGMFFSINPTKTLIHGSTIIYYKFYNILLLTHKPIFLLDLYISTKFSYQ